MSAVPSPPLSGTVPAAPPDADPVVLEGVSFSHDGEKALEGVSLRVRQGDFLAILGPNGGGKTTLLRLMLGLLRPDSGTVRIFGKPPHEARAHIGYVPQFSTIRQDFPATVLDMALMGAAGNRAVTVLGRLRLWPRDAAARDRAMDLLEHIGIADLAENPVHALSGGQRQRLLLARALMGREAGRPFMLLLDEPTASIDPQGKGCFLEFCDELRKDITLVMVSHELGMASPFFSNVALVNKTLTLLSGDRPDAEALRGFIGAHAPDCPVNLMIRHAPGPGCREAAPRGEPGAKPCAGAGEAP